MASARQKKKQERKKLLSYLSQLSADVKETIGYTGKGPIEQLAQQAETAQRIEAQKKAHEQRMRFVNPEGWKERDVDEEVGKRKYTNSQKDFIRAVMFLEEVLGGYVAQLVAKYDSDDIIELATQYYSEAFEDMSDEELDEVEEEFNKTHGYHIILERGYDPFEGFDFED